MPPQPSYQATLVALLSYLDNVAYDKDQVFSQERLAQITPADILRWMNVKCFGVQNPPLDANPIGCRSTSIMYWKKAISHFMPNRLMVWNELSNQGNPTRSTEINDLIKRVKKKEVRRQGRASQARRSMESREYNHTVTVLHNKENIICRYGIPALMAFQFSMISRVDCAAQFFVQNLKGHNQFPNQALRAKLSWSKNVTEEREAPWQTLLGAMDPLYCVFLNLGLWLETSLMMIPGAALSPYVFAFSDDHSIPAGAIKAKNLVMKELRELFRGDDFFQDVDGLLGSHSVRKFGSSHARRNGASKDDKDTRGRWRLRRVSDVYDDVELPFIDMKVCSILCIGGPVVYVLKPDCVTTDFVLQYVTPYTYQRFGQSVALMLGKALLWAIFSPCSERVPADIRTRVLNAYNNLPSRLPDGENPVEKKLVIVTGDNDIVQLTEIEPAAEPGADAANQQAVGGGAGRSTREMLLAVLAKQAALQRAVADLQLQREQDRALVQQQHRITSTNIRRISRQPARMLANNGGGIGGGGGGIGGGGGANGGGGNVAPQPPAGVALDAALSPTPRSLHVLWEEWLTGIGNRKPARLFTRAERGRVKHKYHRRKVVWDLIRDLIRSGLTAEAAIDRIYTVYGHGQTVTTIINRLKRDKRMNQLHQDLVV